MKLVETEFKNANLAEIGQTLDVKFAWAVRKRDGSYTNNMPFVKCRDFLGDSLWAEETGQTKSIYGFSFDPKKQKISKRNTMLMIKFPNKETQFNFFDNCHYFLDYCDLAGTHIPDFVVDGNLVMLKADPLWRKSVVGISAFTFLLKCLSYKLDHNKTLFDNIRDLHVEKTGWDGQKRMIKVTEADYLVPEFDTLIKNLRKITKKLTTVTGQPGIEDISIVHNWSGFVTCCKHKQGEVGHFLQELQNANP